MNQISDCGAREKRGAELMAREPITTVGIEKCDPLSALYGAEVFSETDSKRMVVDGDAEKGVGADPDCSEVCRLRVQEKIPTIGGGNFGDMRGESVLIGIHKNARRQRVRSRSGIEIVLSGIGQGQRVGGVIEPLIERFRGEEFFGSVDVTSSISVYAQ